MVLYYYGFCNELESAQKMHFSTIQLLQYSSGSCHQDVTLGISNDHPPISIRSGYITVSFSDILVFRKIL